MFSLHVICTHTICIVTRCFAYTLFHVSKCDVTVLIGLVQIHRIQYHVKCLHFS